MIMAKFRIKLNRSDYYDLGFQQNRTFFRSRSKNNVYESCNFYGSNKENLFQQDIGKSRLQ